MVRRGLGTTVFLSTLLLARFAAAFCGFYVAKADSKLFNQASQVVLVRYDDKTVLTMSNDYQGELQEFALVVPVPMVLERQQIHVGDTALIDHLDAYTAPRLVEYFDENPCQRPLPAPSTVMRMQSAKVVEQEARAHSLGVTIEARYTVGEYDILILSAAQSDGLETWLQENGYRIPEGASAVLGSYLRQGMRFFVAKVNLQEKNRLGFSSLRALQIAYESAKFMLPIRLGMVNANGTQELFIYALTRTGRVETTNYRTVKLPTGMDLPVFIKEEFRDFYRAMFRRQVEEAQGKAVFLEYAWDMNWCDPCAADPLSAQELRGLGVFWLAETLASRQQAQEVFVTRLHLRYDAAHFPEDLRLQETGDRTNFQGRYVLRHPWEGGDACPAAATYRTALPERLTQEARTLARLTGWEWDDIRRNIPTSAADSATSSPWWRKLWKE